MTFEDMLRVPKVRFELTTFRLQGGCATNCAISAFSIDARKVI